MSWLNNISFKGKIVGLVLIISMITTLSGYIIIVLRFANEQERKYVNSMETSTKLLAEYCVAPMNFNDSIETRNILKQIDNLPEIVQAKVFDINNKPFATYSDERFNRSLLNGKDYQEFKVEITYKEIYYGYLELIASRQELSDEITNFMVSNGAWLLLLLVLGGLAAYRIQFVITRPLEELTLISKKVSSEADYSLRLKREGKDEITMVYRAFNNMLDQIEKRDEARNIVESNLQKAKEKAEMADKLKTSFLTNMSHEIRTPMNAILGFTSLLIEEELPPEQQKEYLRVINDSGNTLLNLVNDILDISKIEAGEITIIKEQFNLNDLLNELYVSFTEIKMQKGKENLDLRLNNPYFKDNLTIVSDPYRLKQVLMNLINNAIKFTDSGYVEYGLKPADDRFIFYVKDTGIGIDLEHQKIVFERFRKIDEEKTRLFRGAGLGLAICKNLVGLLGGDISLQSQLGGGSEFKFYIKKELGDISLPEHKLEETDDAIDLSSKTIMIAEDEPNNFKYLNQFLQRYKATIIWARDGEEAIEINKSQQIDCVLMDIKMPKVDGYDATKAIKAASPQIKIIAQTAYTSASEIEKCKQAGCDYYIAKPIKGRELEKIIMEVFIS